MVKRLLTSALFCAVFAQPGIIYAAESAPVSAPAPAIPIPPANTVAPAPKGVSLQEAMIEAYLRNPDLESARAELRAVDEQYAQAESGFRPQLSSSASYTTSHLSGDRGTRFNADPKTLELSVIQPIYSGGATVASVDAADKTIKAERAKLAGTEQSVLLSVVTFYMNVVRDAEIVDLNISNESVLKKHLDESNERFRLGDITKTDVAQSESRLAAATAARVAAEGTLKISRADFEKAAGLPPDNLAKPAVDAKIPATVDEVMTEALHNNPALIQAQYARDAAQASTRVVRAELLPSVDLSGALDRTYDPETGPDTYQDQSTVLVQATVPLYAGGGTYSRIRQARQIESQRAHDVDSATRAVRDGVTSAWETLAAANAESESQRVQIDAAKLAAEGVEVEANYGARTVLNVLDAQQEYLNAQVSRVISEHDRIVAIYSLLASMGHLTAGALNLGVPVYNPQDNFLKVKDKWIGTGIDHPYSGK